MALFDATAPAGPGEFSGDPGIIQPAAKGHTNLTPSEAQMLIRAQDPSGVVDATGRSRVVDETEPMKTFGRPLPLTETG